MCLVVQEVVFNLSREVAKQWLVGIAREVQQPIVQLCSPVLVTHFGLIVGKDFDEIAHDVGEEGHATEHDDDGEDALGVTYWVVISISYRTQSRQSIITTYNQLMHL